MTEVMVGEVVADRVERIACRKCGRTIDVGDLEPLSQVECPDCHTFQPVPVRFGEFLLLELLGTGGMGAVYKALDQTLGRYVAIKVMKRSLGDDPHFVENFMREARAAAALNHPNVVQIYSCGKEKGQPYIVMELVSGGRLDELIATGNPMDEVRALEIAIDVAEGLKAANDIGLIHGDVKPANILFDRNGVAKVVDFGLARFVGFQSDTGEIWGTPYYIAPEKARGQKVDHRSDIYSLGATLYHALGAKPPFDGETAADVVVARLKNPAIGLRVIRPTLQPETADVVARMLEADPAMRYPTYASLIADLREALRVAKQQRVVHKRPAKTPVWPFAAATAVILAVVAFVSIMAYRSMHQGVRPAARPGGSQAKPSVQPAAPTSEGTQEVVKAEAQPSPPPEPPKVKVSPLPFSKAGEQEVLRVFELLEKWDLNGVQAGLENLYQRAPQRGIAKYWIRVLQAAVALAQGNTGDARAYLVEARSATIDPMPPGVPHPGSLPRVLARYMLKEVDESAVVVEGERWGAAWFQDLSGLYFGLRMLQEGSLREARKHFEEYLAKQGQDPTWPYSLKPIAKRFGDQLAAFRTLVQETDALLENRELSRARGQWQAFATQTLPLLLPFVSNRLDAIRVIEQKELAQKQLAEQRAYTEQIQADLDRVDQVREENLPLLAQKDYRRASANLTRILSELQTTEGRQTLAFARERYDRMDSAKKFLIARISGAPFREPSDLRGDVVGADLNGVRVALGGHGMLVVTWDQISPRTMLQMLNYYLQDTRLPEKERAEAALNAAVFCYEHGMLKGAATFAAKSVELDPSLTSKVRQLMPGILPEG